MYVCIAGVVFYWFHDFNSMMYFVVRISRIKYTTWAMQILLNVKSYVREQGKKNIFDMPQGHRWFHTIYIDQVSNRLP